MNPQQLLKTSKFYSKCRKCDIEKTLGGEYHPQWRRHSRACQKCIRPACRPICRPGSQSANNKIIYL